MRDQKHKRRSIRLVGHDYAQPGAYFLTICTYQREPLFGVCEAGQIQLSEIGLIAEAEWMRTGSMRREVALDQHMIMPNHMHAILWITQRWLPEEDHVGAHCNAPLLKRDPHSLGSIISGFKGAVTRRARATADRPNLVVWQRNYFDRVIRNERQLNALRKYIRLNPMRWALDQYHVD